MEQFSIFFRLGLEHIADIRGYDHILFIIALCAVYSLRNGKSLLILITAFTLGHSLTLALAVLDVVRVSAELIEMLIPVTILLTALFNIIRRPEAETQKPYFRYGMALFFGLIHGLGFSNYLRTLLLQSKAIGWPLFAFNVGLEAGQLLIVLGILLLCFIFVEQLRLRMRDWTVFLSGIAFGVALSILIEQLLGAA